MVFRSALDLETLQKGFLMNRKLLLGIPLIIIAALAFDYWVSGCVATISDGQTPTCGENAKDYIIHMIVSFIALGFIATWTYKRKSSSENE